MRQGQGDLCEREDAMSQRQYIFKNMRKNYKVWKTSYVGGSRNLVLHWH